MKNKLFLLFFSFLMICFHTNLNAQSYLGVEGGGYLAPGETGLKIGIVSDFKIKKLFSIHPELIYGFQAFIGPYFSYGLKASAINIEDINNPFKEIFSFEDINTHRFDFGVSIGTGLVLEVAKERKMFLDLRYNFGLRDINAHPDRATFNEGTSLTMGFMIPLKKGEEE